MLLVTLFFSLLFRFYEKCSLIHFRLYKVNWHTDVYIHLQVTSIVRYLYSTRPLNTSPRVYFTNLNLNPSHRTHPASSIFYSYDLTKPNLQKVEYSIYVLSNLKMYTVCIFTKTIVSTVVFVSNTCFIKRNTLHILIFHLNVFL